MRKFNKSNKTKTLVMTKEKFESIKDSLTSIVLQIIVIGGFVLLVCLNATNIGNAFEKGLAEPAILYVDNVHNIGTELIYEDWNYSDDSGNGIVQDLICKIRNIKTSHRSSELDEIEEKIKYAAEFVLDIENIKESAEFR